MAKFRHCAAPLVAAALLLGSCAGNLTPITMQGASQPTMIVWLFYGLGGSATSPGVDQIASQLASLPGVQTRGPFFWDSYRIIESDIAAAPATVRKALVGYSCGNESSTQIPADMPNVTFNAVAGIQASEYCPPAPLTPNILLAQETYNADCIETLGLGCAEYQPGPGFLAARLTIIQRPDSHGEADVDPDARADVVSAIKLAMGAELSARGPANDNSPHRLVRHKGQRR